METLMHGKFTVYTDHKNLETLFNNAKNFRQGKLYRWCVRLQDFHFVVNHIKGKDNVFADYLSRGGLPNIQYYNKSHAKPTNIPNHDINTSYISHWEDLKQIYLFEDEIDPYTSDEDVLHTRTNSAALHPSLVQAVLPSDHIPVLTDVESDDPNDPTYIPSENELNQDDEDIYTKNELKKLNKQRLKSKKVSRKLVKNKVQKYDHTKRKKKLMHKVHKKRCFDKKLLNSDISDTSSMASPLKLLLPDLEKTGSMKKNSNDGAHDPFVNPLHTNNKNIDHNHKFFSDVKLHSNVVIPENNNTNVINHDIIKIDNQLMPKMDKKPKQQIHPPSLLYLPDVYKYDSDMNEQNNNNHIDDKQPIHDHLHNIPSSKDRKCKRQNLNKCRREKIQKMDLDFIPFGPPKSIKHVIESDNKQLIKFDTTIHQKYHQLLNEYKLYNDNLIQLQSQQPKFNKSILDNSKFKIFDIYKVSNLTKDIFIEKQNEDTFCSVIMDYLKTKNSNTLLTLPPYVRKSVTSARYTLKSGLLLFNHHNKFKVVVPASLKRSILEYAHSPVHHGSPAVLSKILRHYYWIGIHKDVAIFCSACDTCQRIKRYKRFQYGKMQTVSAQRPFECISIDITGPYPITLEKFRYCVTIIDKYSRYCMIIPVKQIKALDVIIALQNWITYFGAPRYIVSDNGSQFISYIYKHFNAINGIQLRYCSPYHPQANGSVERLHRFINERIACLLYDNNEQYDNVDWVKYLNIIQFMYNSTAKPSLKYSPNEIIFGREVNIPLDKNDTIPFGSPQCYIDYIHKRRSMIYGTALAAQQKYDIQRSRQSNSNIKDSPYSVGDFVLYNIRPRLIGVERKWTDTYIGPFEITWISNDGKNVKLIEVSNPSNTISTVIDLIRPYKTQDSIFYLKSVLQNFDTFLNVIPF